MIQFYSFNILLQIYTKVDIWAVIYVTFVF